MKIDKLKKNERLKLNSFHLTHHFFFFWLFIWKLKKVFEKKKEIISYHLLGLNSELTRKKQYLGLKVIRTFFFFFFLVHDFLLLNWKKKIKCMYFIMIINWYMLFYTVSYFLYVCVCSFWSKIWRTTEKNLKKS